MKTIPNFKNPTLQCWIAPRYLEDADFNGTADDDTGTLVRKYLPNAFLSHSNPQEPVKEAMKRYGGDFIFFEIDIIKGVVKNWPNGVEARFYYKSVDMNYFRLLDENGEIEHQTAPGDTEYVIGPYFMNDYGDYFVLDVNADGTIKNYNKTQMLRSVLEWINNDD